MLCWPFWGGGPGGGLALWCFVVYSAGRFVVYLALCHFVLLFFSPFSIAIILLGEEMANLSAFRMFDRFVFVWIWFPLPLDVWKGLRFVYYSFLFLLMSGKGSSLFILVINLIFMFSL